MVLRGLSCLFVSGGASLTRPTKTVRFVDVGWRFAYPTYELDFVGRVRRSRHPAFISAPQLQCPPNLPPNLPDTIYYARPDETLKTANPPRD
ncbi:hypothetical protein FCM30_08625 [Lelliottia aquatilis]|nr:hypothetical protein [Lelliottia aquatilis]